MVEHPIDQPERPQRFAALPLPKIPQVEGESADDASVEYSHYRTGLSRHRTELSEHRTDLSEFRTDLSTKRTDLSNDRTEMSMRRTGMSFQRTRMSAERTLMSEIRTSLSLIGFGFTIYQAFDKLREAGVIQHAGVPRSFGTSLIVLGILILAGGIVRTIRYGGELRHSRSAMKEEGLIYGESSFPISITLIVAAALFALGVGAIIGIVFDIA